MEEVPVKMCIPEAPEVSAYFTGIVALKHLRQTRCMETENHICWLQYCVFAAIEQSEEENLRDANVSAK